MTDLKTGRAFKVARLILKSMQRRISAEECDELHGWSLKKENFKLYKELTDSDKIMEAVHELSSVDTEAAWQKIKDKIYTEAIEDATEAATPNNGKS